MHKLILSILALAALTALASAAPQWGCETTNYDDCWIAEYEEVCEGDCAFYRNCEREGIRQNGRVYCQERCQCTTNPVYVCTACYKDEVAN